MLFGKFSESGPMSRRIQARDEMKIFVLCPPSSLHMCTVVVEFFRVLMDPDIEAYGRFITG